MNLKNRYRIVCTELGYDAQYRYWWSPFWLSCMSWQEARPQSTIEEAKEICDEHYKWSTVIYYNPSDSSLTYK